jgi:serine/threonine protein kinase
MTALEALTGVEPEKLKDAHTGKVDWPSQVQVSDKLKKILEKMVEHNYKRRYQSAEEVLQALKSAGFRSTLVVAPGGQSTLLSGVFPMWLRFVVAAPLVAILAFFVPLMVRSTFIQHPTQPETSKPGDVQSPTPTPEASDDDIFKRPPGKP